MLGMENILANYMKTYTGRKVDPVNPAAEDILLEDIAHALSLNCRGNGQVTHFYSVAQHCINAAKEAIARGYSDKVVLACLLHDASEAYLTDLIRPVKIYMPKYQEIEERFLAVIYRKFGVGILSDDDKIKVKSVDNDLLEYDLHYLLKEPKPVDGFKCRRDPDLEFVPFEQAEAEYIKLANVYINKLNSMLA